MEKASAVIPWSSSLTVLPARNRELNDEDYETVNTRHTKDRLKDIIELEGPDFIILDIMMPALDGIGICLQLRQWTHVPILMLTTWGTSDGKVRGLNLGSDDYLTEPFGIGALKEKIELTLKRKITATGNRLSNPGK